MESLSPGTHTVTLNYTNSRSVSVELAVVAVNTELYSDDESDGEDNDTLEASDSTVVATPTGDNSNIGVWMFLIAMCIVACSLRIYFHKKQISAIYKNFGTWKQCK